MGCPAPSTSNMLWRCPASKPAGNLIFQTVLIPWKCHLHFPTLCWTQSPGLAVEVSHSPISNFLFPISFFSVLIPSRHVGAESVSALIKTQPMKKRMFPSPPSPQTVTLGHLCRKFQYFQSGRQMPMGWIFHSFPTH